MDQGFSRPAFDLKQFQDPRQAMSAQMNQQKGKKPWWTALISEVGGGGGAAAGAAAGAALGSVVPGLGTAIGGLIGAGIGGFTGGTAGKVVENKVRDNQDFSGKGGSAESAFKEGALNGVLSIGPGQLLKLAKGGAAAASGGSKAFADVAAGVSPDDLLKTSMRGKLYDKGTQILASQYGTISKPVARQTDPLDTISKLADFGITKPQDAERIAKGFTGADGLTNKAVMNAVGASDKVNLSHLDSFIDDALTANGVVGSHAKSVKSFVTGQLGRADDLSAVDPSKALDMMRNIEAHTAEVIGKGGTYHLATTENVLQSKALRDIKESVGDALYETAGANKNVASVLTPQFRNELVSLNPKNAKWQQFVDNTVMKSGSIADLRSTMAPFVRISKIIDEGDTNAITFGGRVSNPLAGGTVGSTLLGIGANVVKNPSARVAGSALRAGATAGMGGIEAPGIKQIAARIAVGSNNPNNLLHAANGGGDDGNGNGSNGASAGTDPNALLSSGSPDIMAQANGIPGAYGAPGTGTDATSALLGQGADATSTLLGQPQQAQGGPSLATLQAAIQEDIEKTGGKNINAFMQLGQIYGIVDQQGNPAGQGNSGLPGNVGKVSAQEYANAKAGYDSVNEIDSAIQGNPSLLNRNAVPGGSLPIIGGFIKNASGSGQLDAIAYNAADKYLKLTTGATATDAEIKNTANKLMPRAGDNPQTVQTKLNQLRSYYNIYLQGAN